MLAALCVSTGCLCYGICIAFTSSAIPSIMEQEAISISLDEATWMSSLLCIGSLFGSLSAVFLMDAVGRKASLLAFSVMSLFIGWTLLMAASQAWQLYVGRFLLGLGAGLEVSIVPVYIHETTRQDMRDICGSFPQIMTALGILICYFMGRSLAWNWLSLAALIFLIPFTFGLYYIPESPPWLVYNDEEDLAFRSMSQIRGDEYDASKEIGRIKELLQEHNYNINALILLDDNDLEVAEHIDHKTNIKNVLKDDKVVRKSLIISMILMMIQQFSGQGSIIFYTAQIFRDSCSSVNPNNCALIIGITFFITSISGLIMKNLISRKLLLMLSMLGMGVSQSCLGVYFLHQSSFIKDCSVLHNSTGVNDDVSSSRSSLNWAPLPLLIIFISAYNIGINSVSWDIVSDLLPLHSRSLTHSLVNIVSNLSWFLVTKTFHALQDSWGLYSPFLMYGSVCFAGLIFTLVLIPSADSSEKTSSNIEINGANVSSYDSSQKLTTNHL